MRYSIALVILAAVPAAAQQTPSNLPFLVQEQSTPADEALAFYDSKPYIPVRRGEVYTAGFLTEAKDPAFGRVIGAVRPPQVASTVAAAVISRGTIIGIRAPDGVSWKAGDTLVIAVTRPGPREWGDVVVPTGLARVVAVTPTQVNAAILTVYGPVRPRQAVYALPPFADRGEVAPVRVPGGARGAVIGPRDRRELSQTGGVLFVDLGSVDGVKIGDFIEFRRAVKAGRDRADTMDELMAVGQAVNVNDQSSTIRLIRVSTPDIPAGTPAVRVATLP